MINAVRGKGFAGNCRWANILQKQSLTRQDLVRMAAAAHAARQVKLRAAPVATPASAPVAARPQGRRRLPLALAACAAGLAALLIGVLAWNQVVEQGGPAEEHPAEQVEQAKPAAPVTPVAKAPDPPPPRPRRNSAVPASPVAAGVSRLNDALDLYPERPVEDVLRAAAARERACTFEWNGGQPALVFGGTKSLTGSLSRCADVVERMRSGR